MLYYDPLREIDQRSAITPCTLLYGAMKSSARLQSAIAATARNEACAGAIERDTPAPVALRAGGFFSDVSQLY